MPDKVKVLYDAVSKDYDVGSYDDFSKKLSDPTKRRAFYDGVGKEYELGKFEDFESKVAPVTPAKPVTPDGPVNIVDAANKISNQPAISVQPDDLRIQQEKQAAAKQESQAKKLKQANQVYEISQGKGAVAKIRKQADIVDRTTVKTITPVVAPSYLNLPGRVGSEFLKAASKLGSTVASIGREANYTKDTGLVGAPALYDENGEKTEYAKKIGYSDDFLGKMVLGANGLSEDANIVSRNQTLPNTFIGRGLTAVSGMAPDLLAASLSGGSSLLETGATEAVAGETGAQAFGALAKRIGLNPFAKIMAARGFSDAYNAAEQKGGSLKDRVVEGLKEGGKQYKEGAMMELMGFGAEAVGKGASNFLKESGIVKSPGAWTNAMTNTAANVMFFGGQPLLAGDKDGAESGAFIGALFGAIHGKGEISEQRKLDKEIKKINPELSINDAPNIIMDAVHAHRISNFFNATPEAVREAYKSKMSADDMNAQALDYGHRALQEGDQAKKKQLISVSDTFRKAADIKRSVENIVDFKQDWHDYLDKHTEDGNITPEQAAPLKQRVDDTALEFSPIEQHKRALADVIEPLVDRNKELKSAVDNEADPVKRAERQAEFDANNEQLKAHQAELDDIAKRQVTGHVKVDASGKVVKLKNDEDLAKENEATDKKILKFQETTGHKIDPIDNVPPIVTRVFEWLDSKVPAIDPKELGEASDWVYSKYKELSAIKKSDSRLLTIEQIESLQKQLGKDITLLENHRNKYQDGETGTSTQLQEQTSSRSNGETPTNQEGAKAGEGSSAQATQEGSTRTLEDVEKDQKGLIAKYHDVLKERGLYDQAKEGKAPKGAIAAAKLEAEKRYGKSVFDLKAERAAIENTQPKDLNVPQSEPVKEEVTPSSEPSVTPSEPENVSQASDQANDQVTTSEPVEVETEKGDKLPINHSDMESIRAELELEPLEKEPTTVKEIMDAAVKSLKAGYNVPNLIKRLQGGLHQPSAKEQAIIGMYIEALNTKNNAEPTPELLNSIAEATEALFAARSRLGLALGATGNMTMPKNDFTNFAILEQKARGVKKLKEKDLADIKAEFDKGEAARKKMEEAYARAEAAGEASSDPTFREAVVKEASKMLEKMKDTISRKNPAENSNPAKKVKSAEEYAAERAKIKQDMLDALKKANRNTYASVPLAPQLIAIAPHIGRLVRSYVEEGLVKLEDIVKRLDSEIDLKANGMTQDDVIDIIAGKYNSAPKKKSDIARAMADLKTEARLLKEIDKLQRAPEPKQPIPAQRRTERIEELKQQVKEARIKNKEDFPEEYDKISIERRTKQLKDRAKELEGHLKNGGFAPDKPAPRKVKLDAEGQKAEDEYIAFLRESNRRRDKFAFENQTRWEKYSHYGSQILSLRRLTQTSLDWSMPFRQVIIPTLNPRHWGIGTDIFKAGGIGRLPGNIKNSMNTKSWGSMFSSTWSRANYDRMMYRMESSDPYKQMVADKLVFNSIDALENKYRNEDFRTSFVYKIPDAVRKLPMAARIPLLPVTLMVDLLEASQRAADGFINTARYELYLRGENNLIKSGVDRTENPEAYKEMAKWVMNMTGRGNLLQSWEAPQMQTILGNTFYGTRLMASRFNMLNPKYYYKMPKAVRMEAMRDILGYTVSFGLMALAAQASGFTVSLNPDEADFLKFKKGDMRFDMTGGVGQYVRTGFRVLHAVYNVMSPAVSSTKTEKYGAFAFKSVTSFFDYKLAPNASYMINAIRQKDALGNKFNPTDFFKAYPMYVDDVIKGVQTGDVIGTVAVVGTSIFGVGSQSYSNKDERKTPDMKLGVISDKGAQYDMEQNGLLDERKKYYNEFYKANEARIKRMYQQKAKQESAKVEADKKKGLTEDQLKYKYKAFYMDSKDITNKVIDAAVDYSKKKILQKHKKLRIAE